MDKESKDAKKITNAQNIIEAHRKAVKLVSVNLRGQQIQIPISVSYTHLWTLIAKEKSI